MLSILPAIILLLAENELKAEVNIPIPEIYSPNKVLKKNSQFSGQNEQSVGSRQENHNPGNVEQYEMFNGEHEKRQRSDQGQRKNEIYGEPASLKYKQNEREEYHVRRIHRNNEKDILVRNRTMEILKNGIKILSPNNVTLRWKNRSSVHENFGKMLSSGTSTPDFLMSASDLHKLPIREDFPKAKDSGASLSFRVVNRTGSKLEPVNAGLKENFNVFHENRVKTQKSKDGIIEYEYDYDGPSDLRSPKYGNQGHNPFEHIFNSDYESISIESNVRSILEQIMITLTKLKNVEKEGKSSCIGGEEHSSAKDPCARWLECKNYLELAFIGQNILPSCPCQYPSTIFYNDAVWDENQKRFFRWRDASSEAERLDIYKPGAVYCIRSLLAQRSTSISCQQCCYDQKLRLITRGSGAGTVNFASPDVSKALHDTIDVLPWRLCKGDFTRYNSARHPNNGNQCPVNPDEEQYELQVRSSKYF